MNASAILSHYRYNRYKYVGTYQCCESYVDRGGLVGYFPRDDFVVLRLFKTLSVPGGVKLREIFR